MMARIACILDADVVSEMMRPAPEPRAARFLDRIATERLVELQAQQAEEGRCWSRRRCCRKDGRLEPLDSRGTPERHRTQCTVSYDRVTVAGRT